MKAIDPLTTSTLSNKNDNKQNCKFESFNMLEVQK